MRETGPRATSIPLPRFRRLMIDWLQLMHRRHTVHALLEVDVTDARETIRRHRAATGTPLSFTAFIVASLARAVAEDRRMHAYRDGWGRLVLFDDVDVAVLVEREIEKERMPAGIVVRAADKADVTQIHREIRAARTGSLPHAGFARWLPLWLLVPGPIRRALLAALLGNPRRRKRLAGTVAVSALGMFGSGTGWGIPMIDCTLGLTVGGIARKPGVGQGGRIEVREYLSLTLSMDHDVVDGAPAARFATRLKELIETGAALAPAPAPARSVAL